MEGFLLDERTIEYIDNELKWMKDFNKGVKTFEEEQTETEQSIDFFMKRTLRIPQTYHDLTCGVLVKNKSHVTYFHDTYDDIMANINLSDFVPGFGTLFAVLVIGILHEYTKTKLFLLRSKPRVRFDIPKVCGFNVNVMNTYDTIICRPFRQQQG